MATEAEKLKFVNSEKDDTILLFTNGEGEPKAINVDRCIDELGGAADPSVIWTNSGLPTTSGYDFASEAARDFVNACPRVPMRPISFEFFSDSSKSSRNFENVDGIQFTYQVVYKNGSTSSIAPYSDVAYAPQITTLGTKSINEVSVENACRLFIPFTSIEAEAIRIIAREGNDSEPRVIDTLFVGVDTDVASFSDFSTDFVAEYVFYNDRVGTILSEIDSSKNFDNVPRSAHAQTVADNRVMYGNYTEGYPNIITDAELTVEFDQAPPPGFSFELTVKPYTFLKPMAVVDRVNGNTLDQDGVDASRWKTNTGIIVDTDDFPNQIPPGRYTINVTVSPQKNYHVYLGKGDRCMYDTTIEIPGLSGAVIPGDTEVALPPLTIPGGLQNPASSPEYNTRSREHGALGVGADGTTHGNLSADYFDGTSSFFSGSFWDSTNGSVDFGDVGGSYSSPLIVKGESIELRTVLRVDQDMPKADFSEAIVHGLCGLAPQSSPIATFGQQVSPSFTPGSYFKEYSFDITDQLAQGSSFSADSDIADLITSWSQHGHEDAGGNYVEADQAAKGFFVLSAGTVRFAFEPARGYYGTAPTGGATGLIYGHDASVDNSGAVSFEGNGYGIIMSFAHIEDAVCDTVVPTPDFGWGAAASPAAANGSLILQNIGLNPGDEKRAQRYFAMGTSQWSTRYDSINQEWVLMWPSCIRQWQTPDGTLNGPACLQHEDTAVTCFGDQANNGSVNLAESKIPGNAFPGPGQIAPAPQPTDDFYHPAPIGKWFCLGGAHSDILPTDLPNSFFQSFNSTNDAFTVAIDVPTSGSQSASDFTHQSDPSGMLGPLSAFYIGYINEPNQDVNGRQIFRLARDIPYSLPSSSQVPSTYLERGTLSVIDGSGGVAGNSNYGANLFGNRADSFVWGNPLFMGYHTSGQNPDVNGVGRMANPRGSVTNFALIGYKDNLANTINGGEVFHRNKESVVGAQFTFGYSIVDVFYGTSYATVFANRVKLLTKSAASDSNHLNYPTQGTTSIIFDDLRGTAYYNQGSGVLAVAQVSDVYELATGSSYTGAALSLESFNLENDDATSALTSFKTKANHEFGIVYFDERGRHGAVQPLPSVYVPGYDDMDRPNAEKGSVSVKIDIFHRPPDWAKHYKIVYAGNTSVGEFTQYSAAGAFVPAFGPDKNRIYLSLNHLQGNDISYAEGYGAVSQDDGSKNIYRFADGDKLRVLFYSTPGVDSLNYPPEEYDFRIVEFVLLDKDQADHPLASTLLFPDEDDRLNGQFLVLENNEYASGFTVDDILAGNDLWSNRCIFEVFTPFSALDSDIRPYYETNYGGRVITTEASDGTLTHEYNTIIVNKGDVFYRAVPTNVQIENAGVFEDLVTSNNSLDPVTGVPDEPSQENFVSYFLETEGVTDLYKSKAKNFGRIHFVDRFANEVERKSSISFSEQTPLGSYEMRYFSFPQIGNFKDLPFTDGAIDRLTFEGTHLMSFNDSRLYKVPVTRDTLTLSGVADDAIVASAKVLGTEVAIPFDGGSSGRPESVISINNDFFFFDATNERLVMVQGGKTPVVITESGVNSYFREEVKKWKANGAFKAPSGYDPTRSEYIFTLHDRGDVVKFFDAKATESNPGADEKMITMGFDLKSKKFWKSRYTYSSPLYSNINECLISFHKEFDSEDFIIIPWIHEKNAPRNNFFGASSKSNICIASNQNPSKVKEYDALVLDSDSRWEANLETKNGLATIPYDAWRRYNEKWYAPVEGTVLDSSGFVDKRKSSHTDILTVPFSIRERVTESAGGQSVQQTVFLGPKRFRLIEGENGVAEFEFKIRMPLNATAYGMPLPIGQSTSLIMESDPGSHTAVPLGMLESNAHVFPRRSYVYSENAITDIDNDGINEFGVVDFSEIVVRQPAADFFNYCASNGYQDVLARLAQYFGANPGAEFILDESQNDATGWAIFDILFAPYYSMQFGVTVSQIESLNNIIAEVNGGGFTFEFVSDITGDGFVTSDDLINFLSFYNQSDPAGGIPGDFNDDGTVGSGDILIFLGEFGIEPPVTDVDLSELNSSIILSIYEGTRKQLHVAYNGPLNTEPLIGRYMKIDLLSDDLDDDAELFEVGVDTDTRVKSVSNISKRPAARSAVKRAK